MDKTMSKKKISRNEVRYLWKSIDRKLKMTTADSEVSGKLNTALAPLELLPLEIPEDKLNLFGTSANDIANRQEQIELDKLNRKRRYERLRLALEHPEIDGCANIYADEATTEDSSGMVIHIQHPEQDAQEIVESMFERIGMEEKAWQIIKNFISYGDEFYELVITRTGNAILKIDKLPKHLIERIEENNILKGFKVNTEEIDNTDSYFTYQFNFQTQEEEDEELIYPFRILHFKTNSDKYGVYGQSIIDTVINTIDQLQMMEKALVVARVTRAPERRVYTVDVGNLQGEKAIKYANAVVANFKGKKKLNLWGGPENNLDLQRDIFGNIEDIVIPKRAGSEGNQITTLEQANPSNIEDLEFLRDKIFPALGIPRQYFYDDTFANANTNLASKSVPFAKRVKRVQRAFLNQCYKLAIIELKLKGYSNEIIGQLLISMNNPSNIDDREKITLEMERWGLIGNMKALNAEKTFYPDYLIYQDILKLNKDEIVLLMKLNMLQDAGQNPFDIFDIDDKPDLAKDVDVIPVAGGAEGGGMAGGAGFDDMGGAGDMGGDEGGGEEGAELELPDDVSDALGPPPEETDMMDSVKTIESKHLYLDSKSIAKKNKDKLLQKFLEQTVMIVNKEEQIKEKEYKKMNIKTKRHAFFEIFINGQLEGLDKVNKKVKIYSEDEDILNIF